MSLDQAQRALNQIDKDIADLEKKMARVWVLFVLIILSALKR